MHAKHVVAGVLLLGGFFVGRGMARALDLTTPPEGVEATTTVGLTQEPAEGAGTRDEDEDDDTPAATAAAPVQAAPAPVDVEPAPAPGDALANLDEDALEHGEGPKALPAARRGGWEVGADLKRALDSLQRTGEGMTAVRNGQRARTTLRADLQEAAGNLLRDYEVPAGAVVVLDPRTGEILASAGNAQDHSFGNELALVPLAPAASVFKIVTGAALLEKGVSANKTTCYSGGMRRVRSRDLANTSPKSGVCKTFAQALAHSANIPFARMTQDHLQASDLSKWAGNFMFNRPLPMGIPASPAHVPSGGMEFALTGAGFGDVRMSALHGALVASAVATGGVMPRPVFWQGESTARGQRVMDAGAAHALGDMMEMTVTEGTAKKAFRERRRYALGNIRAAGKTGSLAEHGPFRDYSWFVGYAPADKPTVVVAAFIMNNAEWRVRASYVGREMLATALLPGHKPYRPAGEIAHR